MTERYTYSKFLPETPSIGGKTIANPAHVHLSFGFPQTDTFPLEALARASAKAVLQDGHLSLHYSGGNGISRIKKHVIERSKLRGIYATPSQILTTAGAGQGLDIVARIVANEGDEVWVEAPTFFSAIRAFELAGATVQAFPLDTEGVQVDLIERELQKRAATGGKIPKLLYVMPNYQNPTGINLSLARREKLAALALQYNFYILEDDAYAELNYSGTYLPAIYSYAPGRTIYISTFSKTIGPGVRVGWAIANEEVIQKLQVMQLGSQTSPFVQQTIAQLMDEFSFEDHVAALHVTYRELRDVMVKAIRKQFRNEVSFVVPDGGFFIWLRFAHEVDVQQVIERAFEKGVSVVDGASFYVGGEGGHNELRLCFTYSSAEQIERGVSYLAEAYSELYGAVTTRA